MNKLVQPWQHFLRKQRLPLVTSVQDEIAEIFVNLIPINVLLFSTDIVIFNGVDEQKEHIQFQFRPISKDVNTKVYYGKKSIIHSKGTKAEVLYKETTLSPEETKVLRELFYDCYQWCQTHLEENVHV